MNLHQFINILLSHRWLVLSALTMTVLTTVGISLLLPKQYVATASIVAEQRNVDPITGMSLPVQMLPAYIATQVDVITSHSVARKVVEKLKLNDNPEMQQDFAKSKSTGDINDWIADMLQKKLEVRPSRESSVMQVDFTYNDPQFAANVANAFAETYIQTSIKLQAQPAKMSADWFDTQMAPLRERVEHAQLVLSSFQQQHGIVGTDDRLDLESTRLAELSRQLLESQARTSDLQAKKDLLAASVKRGIVPESLQEVLNNTLIQSLKSELARQEARFAELSKRVDVNHPQYKQVKAEVSSLEQKIQSEIRMVLNSIASGVASSEQHSKLLADALSAQKAKVLELKKQRDEIAVFNREVESAQRVYDAAMQRAVQSRMESEMSHTNISILNPALPPQKPASPKILLNAALAMVLGMMLGVGAAILAELTDRRVRSAFDISEVLEVPVFEIISTSSHQPKRLAHIVNYDNSNNSN
ncbi:MAG: chain length determinant protein EpsF [Methylobacter sp.]